MAGSSDDVDPGRDDIREAYRATRKLDVSLHGEWTKAIIGAVLAVVVSAGSSVLIGVRWQATTEAQQAQQAERLAELRRALEYHRDVEVPALQRTLSALTTQLAVTTTQLAAATQQMTRLQAVLDDADRRRR